MRRDFRQWLQSQNDSDAHKKPPNHADKKDSHPTHLVLHNDGTQGTFARGSEPLGHEWRFNYAN